MRKLLWLIVCLMTMLPVEAQEKQKEFSYLDYQKLEDTENDTFVPVDDVFVPSDTSQPSNNGIALAGKYLKKSANCELMCITFAVAGGGFAIAASEIGKTRGGDSGMFWFACGMCGFGSLVAYFAKINYKFKSGKTLEYYGNGVRLNF